MSQSTERVLSAIQPTGSADQQVNYSMMHLGNYFGAVRNWVKLQDAYECVFGVVDLHAMTVPYEPKSLRRNTENIVIDLLACGIDPEKAVLFIQSLVPEHTELNWVFNCLTAYGDLQRQTQFKDKMQQLTESHKDALISTGLFTYPVLQAADILVYRAHRVPVGKDQEQHLELSRGIANRFNHRFGREVFPEPQILLTEVPKLMSLADPTKKMSKSLGDKHYIALFEDEKRIMKKIKSAVTDSGATPAGEMSPGVENLFTLIKATGKHEAYDSLMADYKKDALRYSDLKNTVIEGVTEVVGPIRERKAELEGDRSAALEIAYEGSKKARALASETIRMVRELTGLPPMPEHAPQAIEA